MGVLQAPGRLGGLQEPPGASRGLQGAPGPPGDSKSAKPDFERKMRPPRTAKASNLGLGRNFTRDGQAGLGHPPLGGGLRSGQGSVEGVFLKGSERPEAGCLGEYVCVYTYIYICSVQGSGD